MEQVVSANFDIKQYRGHMEGFFRQHIPIAFYGVHTGLINDSCLGAVTTCMEDSANPKGLLLSGPVGTGKTSALYVIFKHLLWMIFGERIAGEQRRDVPMSADQIISGLGRQYSFLTHFELIRQLRAYYERSNLNDEQPVIFRVPLLFIDDLGRGYDDKSGWNVALLDEFFDHRYQHRLRVFVTTNKTPQELRAWDNWERVIDRLCDPSWMCTAIMAGKSKRTQEFVDRQKDGAS